MKLKQAKFTLVLLLLVYQTQSYGQENLPSEIYYKEQMLLSELPSETYYNKYIRSAGEYEWGGDDGPGGSGDSENQGVGVLLDDGVYCLLLASVIYSLKLYSKKKKKRARRRRSRKRRESLDSSYNCLDRC